jgi:hypothetical protein
MLLRNFKSILLYPMCLKNDGYLVYLLTINELSLFVITKSGSWSYDPIHAIRLSSSLISLLAI